MVGWCRIQMPPFRQPGRTKGHAEDPGGLFVIASSPSVRRGQLAPITGSPQLTFGDRLASMGLGLIRRWGAFASHKVSALAYEPYSTVARAARTEILSGRPETASNDCMRIIGVGQRNDALPASRQNAHIVAQHEPSRRS
jgi:hypothetical protein